VRHIRTIRTSRVPLPKTRSCADTVIARTALPNLRHPLGAIASLLLRCQKSAINISRESDVVQALLRPKARGDYNVPQPNACGDHNFPQYQKATFEVAKWFMETIIFTKTPSQSFPMRSTGWFTKLTNYPLKPRIVSGHEPVLL